MSIPLLVEGTIPNNGTDGDTNRTAATKLNLLISAVAQNELSPRYDNSQWIAAAFINAGIMFSPITPIIHSLQVSTTYLPGCYLVIRGLGFLTTQSVYFGSQPALSWFVASDTELHAFPQPASAGAVLNLIVNTAGGQTVTKTGALTFTLGTVGTTVTPIVTPDPVTSRGYRAMCLGNDNLIWFGSGAYGGPNGFAWRINADNSVTQFPVVGGVDLIAVCAGPGGNLWFIDEAQGTIILFPPSGTGYVVTPLPTADFNEVIGPAVGDCIITGPDGRLWILGNGGPQGPVLWAVADNLNISLYYLAPTLGYIGFIVTGADGYIYALGDNTGFAGDGSVVRIDPATGQATIIVAVPDMKFIGAACNGGGGDIFFCYFNFLTGNSYIAKYNVFSKVLSSAILLNNFSGVPAQMTYGTDGNIWFATPNIAGGSDNISRIYKVNSALSLSFTLFTNAAGAALYGISPSNVNGKMYANSYTLGVSANPSKVYEIT